MLPVGIRAVLEELPERVRLLAGVSISLTVKLIGPAATSSFVIWSAISTIVGASLMGLTVKMKVSEERLTPSLTVTVMVAVPNILAAGVTVTLRTAPLPPKTMLLLGTRDGVKAIKAR